MSWRRILDWAARFFLVGWAVRNVLGALLVIPVFAKMIEAGGTPMAIWIAFCSIVGIALNIILPTAAYLKLRKYLGKSAKLE